MPPGDVSEAEPEYRSTELKALRTEPSLDGDTEREFLGGDRALSCSVEVSLEVSLDKPGSRIAPTAEGRDGAVST